MKVRAQDELGLDDEFDLVEQVEIDAAAEINEQRARAESVLRARKVAYGRVFKDGGATADDILIVVGDLKRFCRHDRSTFHPNVQMAARLDGRREVILRVDEYLNLSVVELMQQKFAGE